MCVFPLPVERFIYAAIVGYKHKHSQSVVTPTPYSRLNSLYPWRKGPQSNPAQPGQARPGWAGNHPGFWFQLQIKFSCIKKKKPQKAFSSSGRRRKNSSYITGTSGLTERQVAGHLPLARQHRLKDSLTPPVSRSNPLRTHLHFRH